jgi:Mn2+/Fe2+ NRAMP family transporter
VLLPLHVVALLLLAQNKTLMGESQIGLKSRVAAWVSIALIVACVGALTVS